jgi:2-polyprenyl-6-methoxyphenol hydroxylase-like FAD-dependent oxidoreductase
MPDQRVDVVVVGGGIAGSALATALARGGREVLLLERQETYADRVRGEWIAGWGLAEADRLGVLDALLASDAGAGENRTWVFYDENYPPDVAEAAPLDLTTLLPGRPGAMTLSHPATCETLAGRATKAGAAVLRGVADIRVTAGAEPEVAFAHAGVPMRVRTDLIVGADGRNSSVRHQLGLGLAGDPAPTLGSGLLVSSPEGWPAELSAMATVGRTHGYVFPRRDGVTRLYLEYPVEDSHLYTGPGGNAAFLRAFDNPAWPAPQRFPELEVLGPFAGYAFHDTWLDGPVPAGAVLVGDAAGFSNPTNGQGLSSALRDARLVAEALLEGAATPARFEAYVAERTERMRRIRASSLLYGELFGSFGPEAAARRARVMNRVFAEELLGPFLGNVTGHEVFPAELYTDEFRADLLATPA